MCSPTSAHTYCTYSNSITDVGQHTCPTYALIYAAVRRRAAFAGAAFAAFVVFTGAAFFALAAAGLLGAGFGFTGASAAVLSTPKLWAACFSALINCSPHTLGFAIFAACCNSVSPSCASVPLVSAPKPKSAAFFALFLT